MSLILIHLRHQKAESFCSEQNTLKASIGINFLQFVWRKVFGLVWFGFCCIPSPVLLLPSKENFFYPNNFYLSFSPKDGMSKVDELGTYSVGIYVPDCCHYLIVSTLFFQNSEQQGNKLWRLWVSPAQRKQKVRLFYCHSTGVCVKTREYTQIAWIQFPAEAKRRRKRSTDPDINQAEFRSPHTNCSSFSFQTKDSIRLWMLFQIIIV